MQWQEQQGKQAQLISQWAGAGTHSHRVRCSLVGGLGPWPWLVYRGLGCLPWQPWSVGLGLGIIPQWPGSWASTPESH